MEYKKWRLKWIEKFYLGFVWLGWKREDEKWEIEKGEGNVFSPCLVGVKNGRKENKNGGQEPYSSTSWHLLISLPKTFRDQILHSPTIKLNNTIK